MCIQTCENKLQYKHSDYDFETLAQGDVPNQANPNDLHEKI